MFRLPDLSDSEDDDVDIPEPVTNTSRKRRAQTPTEDEQQQPQSHKHHRIHIPEAISVWRHIAQSVAGIEHAMAESAEHETSIVSLQDYYDSDAKQSSATAHLVNDGDKRLARVLKTLDSFEKKPTPGQRTFLNSYIDAVLPLIYGKCWDGSMMRVLRERRLKRIISEVLVIASRQIGKTNAIAMFCAAMLLSVPGIRIGVYSTGTRASSHVSETVLEMLQNIPGADRRIIRNSQECVYVAEHPLPAGIGMRSTDAKLLESDVGTSQLMSYPDNATGTFLSCFAWLFACVYVHRSKFYQGHDVIKYKFHLDGNVKYSHI